jgi:hypothetical protein
LYPHRCNDSYEKSIQNVYDRKAQVELPSHERQRALFLEGKPLGPAACVTNSLISLTEINALISEIWHSTGHSARLSHSGAFSKI